MGRSSPAPRHGRPPSWRNGGESEAGEGRTPRGGRERAPGIGNTEENRNAIRYLEEHRRTSRGSTTMAISPARLRSDPSIRVRCGDGPSRLRRSLRAGLSAAISAPLRFPLLSLSPPLAGARCALRLPGRRPRPGSQSRNRTGASGTVANNIPLDVMAHCPTRARCANPLRGSYTTLRSVPALARKATALRA